VPCSLVNACSASEVNSRRFSASSTRSRNLNESTPWSASALWEVRRLSHRFAAVPSHKGRALLQSTGDTLTEEKYTLASMLEAMRETRL